MGARGEGYARRRASGERVKAATRILALASLALATSAQAEDDLPQETLDAPALFASANEALAANRPGEAIAKLEALADRGIVDPAISFDRGLAYATRVRSGQEQPGDLGRAAHGFEEARDLTKDDALSKDAATALASVRSEIARRRSRAGESVSIEHGFSLGRTIVLLLPENAWSLFAAATAIVLAIAILVRSRVTLPRGKVAATTAGAIAGFLLVTTSALAWAARDARLHLREGVVIAPNARLLDARHLVMDGTAPVPEGARATILDEGGGYSHVAIGGATGYLPSSAILPLVKR